MNYETFLFALCLWREARGESPESRYAVAWTIRNRFEHPTWWGRDYVGVITHPYQYSSMTFKGDPNTIRFPQTGDKAWAECLATVNQVLMDTKADPTSGAVSYFDKSLDKNPPKWSVSAVHTCDAGNFHFFKF